MDNEEASNVFKEARARSSSAHIVRTLAHDTGTYLSRLSLDHLQQSRLFILL